MASYSQFFTQRGLEADPANALVRSARRIENPTLRGLKSADCASCHLTDNVLALVERDVLQGSALPEIPAETFTVLGKPVPRSSDKKDFSLWAIRNFGYAPIATDNLSISQRTVNETVVALRTANAILGGKTLRAALESPR